MLAPKVASETVKAGDDEIVLRLNFFSISLLEDAGIDILNDGAAPQLKNSAGLTFLKCLALEEQDYFTEDHAAALVQMNPEGVAKAIQSLWDKYGGKAEVGNGKTAGKKKAA